MNFRNELVKKYFTKKFNNETEIYESSMKYRIECIENGVSDDVNITKYLNTYEINNIFILINSEKQTEEYKKWFNKVFGNKYCLSEYKKSKSFFKEILDAFENIHFIALINSLMCATYVILSLWGCLITHIIFTIIFLTIIHYKC